MVYLIIETTGYITVWKTPTRFTLEQLQEKLGGNIDFCQEDTGKVTVCVADDGMGSGLNPVKIPNVGQEMFFGRIILGKSEGGEFVGFENAEELDVLLHKLQTK